MHHTLNPSCSFFNLSVSSLSGLPKLLWILENTCYCLLKFSYYNGYELASHCSFDLIFLMTNTVNPPLMYLLGICLCSFEKCLLKLFTHFLIRFFVFILWVICIIHSENTNPLFVMLFSSSTLTLGLSFHFLDGLLWSLTALNFDVRFTYFSLVACAFSRPLAFDPFLNRWKLSTLCTLLN